MEKPILVGNSCVPGARIVELPGAELYMFLSNEPDIIREMRAFTLTLDQ